MVGRRGRARPSATTLAGWFELLADTASKVADRIGGLGPFTPREIATLVGGVFFGIETMILLGFERGDDAVAVGAAQGRRRPPSARGAHDARS